MGLNEDYKTAFTIFDLDEYRRNDEAAEDKNFVSSLLRSIYGRALKTIVRVVEAIKI